MLKVCVAVAALLAAGPASAQVAYETPDEWSAAHERCRMGETPEGVALSEEEIDVSCAERENLSEILKSHGYCWSAGEQEWFTAGNDGGFCETAEATTAQSE